MTKNMTFCRLLESQREERISCKGTTHAESLARSIGVPRISRLMAIAIHFENIMNAGVATDQLTLANLGNVSRARITQIMNLLNLAPEIQSEILGLTRSKSITSGITERRLRPILETSNWSKQSALWRAVNAE